MADYYCGLVDGAGHVSSYGGDGSTPAGALAWAVQNWANNLSPSDGGKGWGGPCWPNVDANGDGGFTVTEMPSNWPPQPAAYFATESGATAWAARVNPPVDIGQGVGDLFSNIGTDLSKGDIGAAAEGILGVIAGTVPVLGATNAVASLEQDAAAPEGGLSGNEAGTLGLAKAATGQTVAVGQALQGGAGGNFTAAANAIVKASTTVINDANHLPMPGSGGQLPAPLPVNQGAGPSVGAAAPSVPMNQGLPPKASIPWAEIGAGAAGLVLLLVFL